MSVSRAMKIYRNLDELPGNSRAIATVGTFDGVHLGHKKIIEYLRKIGRQKNLLTTLVTFHPHPRKVIGKPENHQLRILTDLEEKLRLFEDLGIEQTIIIPFTREFAQLTYDQFVKDVLIDKIGVREMVVGYDHHFGKNREGGFESLKELGKKWGFGVHKVGPFQVKGQVVSSSLIRRLLDEGNVELASRYLGRPYKLSGIVVPGDGRGKEIGYPTANIKLKDPDKIIPARGVYAVDIRIGEKKELYKGMMNIGLRPTFNSDSLTLEVHIFKFKNAIYNEQVEVHFKKFVRKEKKFRSLEELKTQLDQDKKVCINL